MRNINVFLCLLLVGMTFAFSQDREFALEQSEQMSPYSDTYMALLSQYDPEGILRSVLFVTIVRALDKTEQGVVASIMIRIQQKQGEFELTTEQRTQEFLEKWFADGKACSGAIVIQGSVGAMAFEIREGSEVLWMRTINMLPILEGAPFNWEDASYRKGDQQKPIILDKKAASELAIGFLTCFEMAFFSEPIEDPSGRYRYGYSAGQPREAVVRMMVNMGDILNRPLSAYVIQQNK